MEPRRELRPAQHPQRILLKAAARHGAQHAARQILHAAQRIDDLIRQRVAHDGVHREIPPERRLRGRKLRVHRHSKVLVTRPCARLRARQRDVDARAPDRVDAVGAPALINLAEFTEQRAQRVRRNAVHLAVDISALPAQQRVAHAAAHQQRASAARLHAPRDRADHLLLIHSVSSSP